MTAQVISTNSECITLELKIPMAKSMLEGESLMQDALNDAGGFVKTDNAGYAK